MRLFTNKSSGGDKIALAREYFATLTRDEARRIYELYRLDIELFGYNPKPFMDLAQH